MKDEQKQVDEFKEFLATIWAMDVGALSKLHHLHVGAGGLLNKSKDLEELLNYARRVGAIETVMYHKELLNA